jgi:hypothetical protein
MHLLVGALVGGAIGLVGAVVASKIAGRPVTWRACLAGALGGAVGGLATAASLGTATPQGIALGQAIFAFGAGGAAGGLTQGLAQNGLAGRPLGRGLLASTVGGLAGGAVAGLTFGLAAPALSELAPSIFSGAAAETPVVVRAAVTQTVAGVALGAPAGATGGAVEQATSNLEDGRPLGTGVARAASQGLEVGSLMGGAGGALGGVLLGVEGPPVPETPSSSSSAPRDGIAQALDPNEERGSAEPETEPPSRSPVTDARAAIERSPSLRQQVSELEAQGWRIRYGGRRGPDLEGGRGIECNWRDKEIVFDVDPDSYGPSSTRDLSNDLAHEVGHAIEGAPVVRWSAGMSRQEFVDSYVRAWLDNEGAAVLNEWAVRAEVLESGGPETPFDTAYAAICDDPSLTRAEKIARIGALYATLQPSGTPEGTTYTSLYTDYALEDWDRVQARRGQR